MDITVQKPPRKTRTLRPKNTEAITATPPKAKLTDTTNIKTNTTDKTLKNATDNFKAQKLKEQAAIKQELKEYMALTKGAAALEKSIKKLEAKHNKIKK